MPLGRVLKRGSNQIGYVQDATARAIYSLESVAGYPYGVPSASVGTSDMNALWGVLNRVNSTLATLSVFLPQIGPQDVGRAVGIVNLAAAPKQVTVVPRLATIDGASTWVSASPYGIYLIIAASTSLWVVHA
jgi:hypothetical protein